MKIKVWKIWFEENFELNVPIIRQYLHYVFEIIISSSVFFQTESDRNEYEKVIWKISNLTLVKGKK